jgi:hypothetical protein
MDPHDLALAYSLSTIAGFRAALTILAVTIAIHVHAIAPPPSMGWLGSDETLAVAAFLAVADFFGDKVPWVDHVLHAIHTVLAPAAGGISAVAVDPNAGGAAAVLGLAGAGNALGLHALRATTRVGTTAVSLGLLTPVVSLLEDVVAVAGIVLAFFSPFIVAALALVATIVVVAVVSRVARSANTRAGHARTSTR